MFRDFLQTDPTLWKLGFFFWFGWLVFVKCLQNICTIQFCAFFSRLFRLCDTSLVDCIQLISCRCFFFSQEKKGGKCFWKRPAGFHFEVASSSQAFLSSPEATLSWKHGLRYVVFLGLHIEELLLHFFVRSSQSLCSGFFSWLWQMRAN